VYCFRPVSFSTGPAAASSAETIALTKVKWIALFKDLHAVPLYTETRRQFHRTRVTSIGIDVSLESFSKEHHNSAAKTDGSRNLIEKLSTCDRVASALLALSYILSSGCGLMDGQMPRWGQSPVIPLKVIFLLDVTVPNAWNLVMALRIIFLFRPYGACLLLCFLSAPFLVGPSATPRGSNVRYR